MQKRIVTAIICLIALLVSSITVFGAEFSDMNGNESYYEAVDELSDRGVINGYYESDEFRPNNNITRAEFCAMLARANGYSSENYKVATMPFTDIVKDRWDEKFISFCFTNNYINGYEDKSFQPTGNVTCEQAVKMVVCASGLDDGTLQQTTGNQKWYDNYVDRANETNLLMPEMGFEAGKPASRAFVAQLVFNSMIVDGEVKASVSDNTKSDESDDFKVLDNVQNNAVASDGYAEEKEYTPIDDGDFWMPESQEEADEATEEYYKYEQYYGEDYEEYVKEEENEKNYTVPEPEEEYEEPEHFDNVDGLKIVIDPGHNYSGVDTGAVGNGLREQDITYKISEKLKPILERNGFNVIMTRESLYDNVSDISVSDSLNKRANIANRYGADLFLSIHCNAGGGTGIETYYCTGSDNSARFAECVQRRVVEEIGLRNRGVKSAKYAVLRNTNMTALLLETAFIDTASDARILGNEDYQQRYAEAIARGICDYTGVEFN